MSGVAGRCRELYKYPSRRLLFKRPIKLRRSSPTVAHCVTPDEPATTMSVEPTSESEQSFVSTGDVNGVDSRHHDAQDDTSHGLDDDDEMHLGDGTASSVSDTIADFVDVLFDGNICASFSVAAIVTECLAGVQVDARPVVANVLSLEDASESTDDSLAPSQPQVRGSKRRMVTECEASESSDDSLSPSQPKVRRSKRRKCW